jgi:aconitate hydratase
LAEPVGLDLPPDGFGIVESGYQKPVHGRNGENIIIAPGSDRLQLLLPFKEWDGYDYLNLPLLIKAKGKCTTDHISMAGFWLKYRGHLENISENYMIGAVNYFNDQTNLILNQLSGSYEPVPRVARAYRNSGSGSAVVGEENFGEGSSREHAAMEPRFLGVKVVLVKSFARIHETNLKKQGVLTLTFVNKDDYDKIKESDKIDVTGLVKFTTGKGLTVTLSHSDGTKEKFQANHSYNESQIEWFKAGSALNIIRKSSKKNVI